MDADEHGSNPRLSPEHSYRAAGFSENGHKEAQEAQKSAGIFFAPSVHFCG
jgi:hypothetical protein